MTKTMLPGLLKDVCNTHIPYVQRREYAKHVVTVQLDKNQQNNQTQMKCRFMLFIEAINTKDPTKQAEETQKRDNN